MKIYLLGATLCFLLVASSLAQDSQTHELEIITPDNLSHLQEIARWETLAEGAVAAAFSPDGQTFAISLNDGTIQFLDTATLEVYRTLDGVETFGTSLQFSPDGKNLLLSRPDATYLLWDVETGQRIIYQPGIAQRILFTPSDDLSSYMVYWFDSATVSVHYLQTGIERIRVPHADLLPFPKLSDDGRLLLTKGEKMVEVWDTNSGELRFSLGPKWEVEPNRVGDLHGMGFTPHREIWTSWQRLLASGENSISESKIQFWDSDNAQLLLTFKGQHWYEELYFDPTDRYFAAVGTAVRLGSSISFIDGTIWLWDIQSQKELGLPQGSTGGVSLAFSPSGELYADTGGTSPRVVVHQVGVDRPGAGLDVSNLYNILGSGVIEFAPNGKLLLHVGVDVRLWGVPTEEN